MKSYFLKILLLLLVGTVNFACDETEEVVDQVVDSVACNFELDFTITKPENAQEIIELQASSSVENPEYIWIIDGQIIENTNNDNSLLILDLKENSKTFCVKIITDNCEEGKQVCKENPFFQPDNVDNGGENENDKDESTSCGLSLEFTYEKLEGNTISVSVAEELQFSGYVWKINGAYIETNQKTLEIELTKPDNQVCLFIETPDCPKGEMICKDIVIDFQEVEEPNEEDIAACEVDFNLNIEISNGLDLNIICDIAEFLQSNTFQWTVNGTTFDPNEDGTLHWGPSVGTTEFCFTTFTDQCPEGITQCASFVLTQEQVISANRLLGNLLPRLGIIEIEENVFTFQLED